MAIEEYSKHNNKRQKKRISKKIEETSYSYKSKIYDTNEKETGYSYKSKIYEINDNDKSNSNEKNENFGNRCFQRYRNSKKIIKKQTIKMIMRKKMREMMKMKNLIFKN